MSGRVLAVGLLGVLGHHGRFHLPVRGPVLLGEFGAFRDQYGDITPAARAMRDLQVQTCDAGLSGWLFWTYDTIETADQRRPVHAGHLPRRDQRSTRPQCAPRPCHA
jgi:hypothetical protein